MQRLAVSLVLVLSIGGPRAANADEPEEPLSLCGTFPGRGTLELAKHRFLRERLGRDPARALRAVEVDAVGDLVVLTDDGTLVSEANRFDLRDRSLIFSPRGERRYRFRIGQASVEPGLGERIRIGDDATSRFDLGFVFRFFGRDYRQVFVNSDGNLTFDRGDRASTRRGLQRFLSGPPRIALFFSDLDPTAGGEVRIANLPDRFVVTWDDVPEFGESAPNRFQLELASDGTVRMRYGSLVSAASGIVGLSPGESPEEVSMVDLSAQPEIRTGAVVEQFQRGRMIDNVETARHFFGAFPDRYDTLVVWTNFDSDLDDAFAFAVPIQNDVRGIGESVFDDSAFWGSEGELESFIFMGNLKRYPRSPERRVFGAASRPTTLGLLAHEVGHRWLARALVGRTGLAADSLLGRQRSHWSFFLDSDASFLEGNDIEQESERRFRTVSAVTNYSRLDLYLMGLAPASEVAPFFVVTDTTASTPGRITIDNETPPRPGVVISGDRNDVTLDDVVGALGRRRPGFEQSQKSFRHAWILLTRGGEAATNEDITRLQDALDAFAPFFNRETLGRGHISTSLDR